MISTILIWAMGFLTGTLVAYVATDHIIARPLRRQLKAAMNGWSEAIKFAKEIVAIADRVKVEPKEETGGSEEGVAVTQGTH